MSDVYELLAIWVPIKSVVDRTIEYGFLAWGHFGFCELLMNIRRNLSLIRGCNKIDENRVFVLF